MFGKAYKLKSNNTLKNSEKKHLAQRILNEFPAATDENVKELVPVKSNTSCMKLMLHSGESVGVYVVDNVPMMIETGDLLVPTVCALWKVPDLLPTLIIHSPVLPKLAGGAPLYAPGVTLSDAASFPRFPRGALVAAATADNSAAGAIGRAVISSTDLLRTTMGVCMETLHVFGDLLCKEPKFTKLERPKLQPPAYSPTADNITADIAQLNIQQPIREEWPSLVRESKDTPPTVKSSHSPVLNEPKTIPEEETQVENNEESEFDETVMTDSSQIEEDPVPTDMDELLQWCLLSFIKLEGKNLQLPLKTNLLYKNHLMPLCPSDRSLDVKKSSYKKMSKFLEAMQQEGLLEVREVEKGVKGTALSAAQVRAALAEHVRAHNLAAQHGKLRTDPLLAALVGPQESITWESAMSAVLGKMTPSTELHFPDGSVKLIKSRLEPIKMNVVTRSGNKKVTLVSNLESYGFRPGELAREVQLGAAASSGVTRSPGAKADQLMVQGDQTHFIAKLLIEKYNLPKKYLEGADKALNKKK
ncbi:Eukaryotic translation initiation factor 2D [Papilio machaon]|uniref:Eukaryotic translation initiation factor 2D n=1 Tax=Papilio machaon TaxID=76193 RepID=A0A194RB28_PAPMA|nr:Eukaryotic translation initiation factor 2D [Papilio machaon]